MTADVIYKGKLRCTSKHIRSGNIIVTDAPIDNNGKGEAFSPTDLVATPLANCKLTVMGIKARGMDANMDGTTAQVTKIMAANPRRISEIHIKIGFPENYDKKTKKILERTALTCPVAKTLHHDVLQVVEFFYP